MKPARRGVNCECAVGDRQTKREKCRQFSRMLRNWNAKASVLHVIGVLFLQAASSPWPATEMQFCVINRLIWQHKRANGSFQITFPTSHLISFQDDGFVLVSGCRELLVCVCVLVFMGV